MQVDEFAPQIIQDSYQKFKCNSKQTILVRSIDGNSKVVGVQRRPPGSHTASWKLAISFSSTIGSFQYSNRFEICFFTMAWSALIEEEVEKGDSFPAAAELSVPTAWISSVATEWSASPDGDIFWVGRLKGIASKSEGKKIGKLEWELMGLGMRSGV
jgi:hypothetical protein